MTSVLDQQIGGMTCASCVHNIEKALLSSGGVQKAVVALATGKGYIEFDPAMIGPRDVINVVKVCYCEGGGGRVVSERLHLMGVGHIMRRWAYHEEVGIS